MVRIITGSSASAVHMAAAVIEIGFMLADKLKINYYDAEIFSAVLKRLQAEQDERIKDSSALSG